MPPLSLTHLAPDLEHPHLSRRGRRAGPRTHEVSDSVCCAPQGQGARRPPSQASQPPTTCRPVLFLAQVALSLHFASTPAPLCAEGQQAGRRVWGSGPSCQGRALGQSPVSAQRRTPRQEAAWPGRPVFPSFRAGRLLGAGTLGSARARGGPHLLSAWNTCGGTALARGPRLLHQRRQRPEQPHAVQDVSRSAQALGGSAAPSCRAP